MKRAKIAVLVVLIGAVLAAPVHAFLYGYLSFLQGGDNRLEITVLEGPNPPCVGGVADTAVRYTGQGYRFAGRLGVGVYRRTWTRLGFPAPPASGMQTTLRQCCYDTDGYWKCHLATQNVP